MLTRLQRWLLPDVTVLVDPLAIPTATGKSRAELYMEVAKGQVAEQAGIVESARTRSAALFTIGSVILPVTASLISDDNSPTLRSDLRWALAGAVVAYVALLAAFVSAVRSATWDSRPALDEWQRITDPAVETTPDDIMRWLGDAYVDAYANNLPEVERRLRWNAAMQGLLAIEVTSLAVAVVVPPLL